LMRQISRIRLEHRPVLRILALLPLRLAQCFTLLPPPVVCRQLL
jgi:hypothetical protein